MAAALNIILTLLLAGEPTLANGIRVNRLPPEDDAFEMIAGYRAGVRNETTGTSGLAATTSFFLMSSSSARALALAAYGAGGDIEFFSELDRTGFRVKVPLWAKPIVEESAARFFAETPDKDPALGDRALAGARLRADASDADFRAKVEDEIRISLLGSHPYHHRPAGWKFDLAELSPKDLEQFFAENYGTDHAFVMMSGAPSPAWDEVPARTSRLPRAPRNDVFKAERNFRFPPGRPAGAVIFASPVPSVYYKGWYAVLLLDRLIQRVAPGKPAGTLIPALDPYYYRTEVAVPEGQLVDSVEENFLHEIERLQYVRAPERDLLEARQSAIEYLDSQAVQRWFLSLGIAERREEGIKWIRSFSADEMRATARDLLVSNRVVASWPPKAKEAVIAVESLNDAGRASGPAAQPVAEAVPIRVPPFPPHTDAPLALQIPERLGSGITCVASSMHAIFVAPGLLDVFEREPTFEIMQSYGVYRPDRILVMAPPAAFERVKQQWNLFLGNPRDSSQTPLVGNVTGGDLPALAVLKTILDRKLIEAALWNDVQLQIGAAEGSQLSIRGSDADRRRVLGWIKEIASRPPSDGEMEWAREVAVHRLRLMLPDIQSLLWQRDPQGILPDLPTVSAMHVQDVAKTYFQ